MIIGYGCAQWRDDWVRPGPDGGPPVYAVPHVIVDPESHRPLRLQDGQYALPTAPPPDLDAAGQLDLVERYLASRADPWSKAQAALIERYFSWVRSEIAAAGPALAQTLGPLRSVFDVAAFAFAAPRPLPQAWLDPDGNGRVGLHCAFWTGTGPVAIELVGRGTETRARRAALDRIEAAGGRVLRLEAADVGAEVFAALFPRFWDGTALPAGPFKARGIEAFAALPA